MTTLHARCSTKRCTRRALWRIGQVYFCNPCFDHYSERHELEPDTIERLSDDERDFANANPRGVEALHIDEQEPICRVPRPIPAHVH